MAVKRSLTPIQRFVKYVDIQGSDECWEWTGGYYDQYGKFHVNGGAQLAHRWLFQQFHPIPLDDHQFVCHQCDNTSCVNPDHLFLGNNSINQLDSVTKGRHGNTKKTHCPQGHVYTPENTYHYRNAKERGPYRRCKNCDRNRHRANYVSPTSSLGTTE